LVRELELSSKLGCLVLATVVFVENLQRHRAIRLGGGMRPVHGRVPTTPEGGVDDIALELHADGKHASSLGRPGLPAFWSHDFFCAASRR
jgi:hypothetical protein